MLRCFTTVHSGLSPFGTFFYKNYIFNLFVTSCYNLDTATKSSINSFDISIFPATQRKPPSKEVVF